MFINLTIANWDLPPGYQHVYYPMASNILFFNSEIFGRTPLVTQAQECRISYKKQARQRRRQKIKRCAWLWQHASSDEVACMLLHSLHCRSCKASPVCRSFTLVFLTVSGKDRFLIPYLTFSALGTVSCWEFCGPQLKVPRFSRPLYATIGH